MTNIPVSGTSTDQKPATPPVPQQQPQVSPAKPADKSGEPKK